MAEDVEGTCPDDVKHCTSCGSELRRSPVAVLCGNQECPCKPRFKIQFKRVKNVRSSLLSIIQKQGMKHCFFCGEVVSKNEDENQFECIGDSGCFEYFCLDPPREEMDEEISLLKSTKPVLERDKDQLLKSPIIDVSVEDEQQPSTDSAEDVKGEDKQSKKESESIKNELNKEAETDETTASTIESNTTITSGCVDSTEVDEQISETERGTTYGENPENVVSRAQGDGVVISVCAYNTEIRAGADVVHGDETGMLHHDKHSAVTGSEEEHEISERSGDQMTMEETRETQSTSASMNAQSQPTSAHPLQDDGSSDEDQFHDVPEDFVEIDCSKPTNTIRIPICGTT